MQLVRENETEQNLIDLVLKSESDPFFFKDKILLIDWFYWLA